VKKPEVDGHQGGIGRVGAIILPQFSGAMGAPACSNGKKLRKKLRQRRGDRKTKEVS
jgi:hypothetical protein